MELQEIERILKESLNVDEVYAQGEKCTLWCDCSE